MARTVRPSTILRSTSALSALLFSLVIIAYGSGCIAYSPPISLATEAETLREQGKLLEAIEAYQQHIAKRLSSPSRAEQENPHFYQLFIGDIYLELDRPEDAERAYALALEKNALPLVSKERLRRLGTWYEEHGQFEAGISVLRKYRDLDPFMFDLELDRLHKEMLRREDEAEAMPDQPQVVPNDIVPSHSIP